MNREEAIANLNMISVAFVDPVTKEQRKLIDDTFDMAIKALKQMPVTTTAGKGGVIYYPQVEGVTPTVVDAGKQEPCDTCGYEEGSIYCKEHCPHEAKIEQEPCEMTAEEYRQRMIQAFHNADTDELIAVCVLPTEKEFEHLEWLLKNHYKNEPCGDAIDRAEAIKIASGYCHLANVAKELAKLPAVNPQPCEDAISRQAVQDYVAKYLSQYLYNDVREAVEVIDEYIGELPSVNPQKNIVNNGTMNITL